MELYTLHMMRDILAYAGILLLVFYLFTSSYYNYWKNRHFPYLEPKFPLGNHQNLFCKFLGPHLETVDYYEEIKRRGYKFAGVFSIFRPKLVVADPEIVKDILVKDFNYFTDRNFYKTKHDPLSLMLFSQDASNWKPMRIKLTPTFTSGKLKMMIPSVVLVSQAMTKKIDNLIVENADINIKAVATTFTINTLAVCAIGIEASNCGREIDIFTEMTEKHFHTERFTDIVRYSLLERFPYIASKLRLNVVGTEVTEFFRKVLRESMICRKQSGISRPDFLDLLINIKNESENTSEPMTEDQLTAEMFLFFLASLDTSSNAVLYALYELANNLEMQERTRNEIIEVLKDHDGQINSDCLNEMKYLRQVIDESLRLYPPLPTLDRKCVKNYKIRDTDLIIEEGIDIIISVFGIHRDPDNYPEPEKFDPERFKEENKKNIRSEMYLPFGMGPRNCIGSMELYLLYVMRDILAYAGILLLVVYLFFTSCYNYWKDRNFHFLRPKFPLGNNQTLLCPFPGPHLESLDYYEEIKRRGYKFAGVFSIVRPILVVVDPKLVKDILIKDFDQFADRGFYKNNFDPLSLSLFAMDAVDWKETRMRLSPTFTSGKIKMMIPSVVSVSRTMIRKIDTLIRENADINIKQIASSYTINTMATCALGIEVSHSGKEIEIFTEMTEKHMHAPSFIDTIRFSLMDRFSAISSKLRLHLLRTEVADFFRKVVKESMAYREKNETSRLDFLQLLMKMKKDSENTNKPLTDDHLVAQVFLFFLASLDTSSLTVAFVLFELANKPEMQEKTRREITAVLKEHEGELNFDCLSKMKYLRQVINESFRLYPPLPTLERKCMKDYKINGTNLIIEKGICVSIPVFGIHRDPDNYPEPEIFDPERFNEENKKNIKSEIYLPFGIGPRNCIGYRLGVMMIQVALIEILKNFRMSVSSTTQVPLEFDKQQFMLTLKNPILFKAQRIQE